MNNRTKTTLKALAVLTALLLIRLGFFLKDGTNDTIESLLIWTIFIGSLGLFIYAFLFPRTYVEYRWGAYLPTITIAGSILFLDMVFIFKNGLHIDRTYLFSMIVMLYALFLLSTLLRRRFRRIFETAVLILYSVYLAAQDLYFRIFDDLFSFQEGVTLKEGIESSENMIRLGWFHGLIVSVVLMALLIIRRLPEKHPPRRSFASKVASAFLLLALLNLNADYPVKMARLHTSDHYLYTSVYSRTLFTENYGSLNLMVRDLSKTIAPDFTHKNNTEHLDQYFKTLENPHGPNGMTGLFKDKNLLYIVGESFDDIAVSEALTPNLYKLKNEGWDFTNHHVPVFPRTTCDSEVIMNTGLIPSIEDGPTCYVYNTNSYRTSIANRFNEAGYLTQAFHNNYKAFYTRDIVYEGFGYDALHGQHELGLSESDKRYDSTFFDAAKDQIIQEDEPFFSSVLTLSGHSPYTDTNLASKEHYDLVDAHYGEDYEEEFKHYVASQVELDRLVGAALEDLEEKELLEDTVIVLTTDHYPYTLDQAIFETRKDISEDHEKARSPLYIYTEGIEPMTTDTLSVSFDVLPTLLNLFGIEADHRYYVGRDLFSEGQSVIYYKDYSVYAGGSPFSLSDTVPEGLGPLYRKALADYEVSKRILRSDYLKTD